MTSVRVLLEGLPHLVAWEGVGKDAASREELFRLTA
jgi:hypothetical protein